MCVLLSLAVPAVVVGYCWWKHRRTRKIPQERQLDDKHKYIKAQYEAWTNQQASNDNIDPELYRLEWYKTEMKRENEIEKKWKSRILMEYTPMGNIVMWYDVYRGGFVYHSDAAASLTYVLLNAVAMKYVKRFHCYDFFMDLRLLKEASPLERTIYYMDYEEYPPSFPTAAAHKKQKDEYRKNKFIRGGTIKELKILSHPSPVVANTHNESVKNVITYSQYKKKQHRQHTEEDNSDYFFADFASV